MSFSNPNGITRVRSFGGYIIDLLSICTSTSCVSAGNIAGRITNSNAPIDSGAVITSFSGSFANWNTFNCLQSFGMTYYIQAQGK